MKITNAFTLFSCISVAVSLLLPASPRAQGAAASVKLADAKPGDVRLFVSGALLAPLQAVQAQAEKAVGHKLVMEVGGSRALQSKIEAGQPFEAALITGPVVDDMIAKGKILAGSRTDLAVVRLGVGVKGDAPKLNVGMPAGLKKAMLDAKFIERNYGLGAAVPTIDNVFTKLDLTDVTKSKIIIPDNKPIAEPPLGKAEYALTFNLVSEMPKKDWTYLGLVPERFQLPVVLSAGVGTVGDAKVARKLIAFLKSPAFDPALKADGMTRQ